MRLTDLLDNLAPLSGDVAAIAINGLAVHSAKVKQGDLFFALPGTARDGRDFIDDAITRGAVAILTDDRPLKPNKTCLLYTSPSPRDLSTSRMPSSA